MRLFVKHPDASFVVSGGEQYPVKNQVVDVPEEVGASLLVFAEYEVYNGQTELHEDFVEADKEATAIGQKEAKKLAKEQAEQELAVAHEAYEIAQAEADRLKQIYDDLQKNKKAPKDAARIAAEEEEKRKALEEEAARLAAEEAARLEAEKLAALNKQDKDGKGNTPEA